MAHDRTDPTRRRFLAIATLLTGSGLLSACGGTEGAAATSVPVAVTSTATGGAAAAVSHPLNLALNLAYVGAVYHGAATGSVAPSSWAQGVGSAGAARGTRAVAFVDPDLSGTASMLATDKRAHVEGLRAAIGAAAAAQPAIDLSTAGGGGFARAAQAMGLAAFDPYGGDRDYLLGGLLIENSVAAAYRGYLRNGGGEAVATANLGDAIHHAALIRALLDDRSGTDPTIASALGAMDAMFSGIDGSGAGDQALTTAGVSANLIDAAGHAIPFLRSDAQVLQALSLSAHGAGGFLPAGANGVAA